MILWCSLAAGCGSDEGPHAPAVTFVSDVGQYVDELNYEDGSVPVYTYQDIRVEGDMAVDDFVAVLRTVAPQLQPNEPVIAVVNYAAFPASYQQPDLNGAELMVSSCTDGAVTTCAGGNWWALDKVGGQWAIVLDGGWIVR